MGSPGESNDFLVTPNPKACDRIINTKQGLLTLACGSSSTCELSASARIQHLQKHLGNQFELSGDFDATHEMVIRRYAMSTPVSWSPHGHHRFRPPREVSTPRCVALLVGLEGQRMEIRHQLEIFQLSPGIEAR